jgi:hypothetical protein
VATKGISKLPEKQQLLVPQRDDLTFDCSKLPCNYISLPIEVFKLFEKFKCRKCHALKQKVFMVERFGWAQSLYYKCRNCNDIECVRANLTSPLEKTWAEQAPRDKTFLRTNQHNCVSAADFERNIQVYLGAQQCGGGRHESRVMAGMLGIHHNALKYI